MLLDSIRGELSPEDTARLSARMAQDPELLRERERWARLLGVVAAAHDLPLDAKAGERAAVRAIDRVRREESRAARSPLGAASAGRRSVFWARFLAVSVAAHVVVLGILGVRRSHDAVPSMSGAERPFTPVAAGPDAPEESTWIQGDVEDPAVAQAGPYALDRDEPLPIEEILTPTDLLPSAAAERYNAFARGSARAMWVRTSDPMKRLIETRVGTPGTLERVQRGLLSLAGHQGADGSFSAKTPAGGGIAGTEGSVRTTAAVLLAFLGDGSSSRGGAHREVAARGVAWLRARAPATVDPADRALACLALAEDFMLSNGAMTPAESRARAADLVALRAGIATAARSGAQTPRDDAAERWAELALGAIARAGVGPAIPAALRFHPPGDVLPAAAVDPRTAMLEGADVLRGGRGDAFATWNRATAKALGAKLSGDGLVVLDGTANLEETALVLLALQVAYRTY